MAEGQKINEQGKNSVTCQKSKRIDYIDIMKAIGIISVVVGHYWAPSVLGYIIWSFHMPLFVMISGYFLKDGISVSRLKKLCKSYLVPYSIVWGCNAVLLSVNNVILHTFSAEWLCNYIKSYFWALGSNSVLFKPESISKVGVIWFLMALFWGELMMLCLLRLCRRWQMQTAAIICIWLAALYISGRWCLPFGILNGISFLPWLYLGHVIKLFREKMPGRAQNNKTHILCIVSAVVVWFCVLFIQYRSGWKFSIAEFSIPKFILGLAGAAAAIYIIREISKKVPPGFWKKKLISVGQATIWILCVHGIGIEVVSPIVNQIVYRPSLQCTVMIIRLILDIVIALSLKKTWHILKGIRHGKEYI